MVMITSEFAKMLAPGLLGVINQGYDQPDDMIDMFFRVENTKRSWEEETLITGLGTYTETNELEPVTYDNRYQGDTKRYTMKKFALAIAISDEMYDDDLYSEMKNYGLELGRSAKESYQIFAFNVFNRAFNASYLGPDSKVLCATDHPMYPSGTQSNRPAEASDLSLTSLTQAESDMLAWTDDRGKKIVIPPAILLIPTSGVLKRKAYELAESEYNPEGVERASNYVRSLGLKYKANPYLTSTKAWFVLGPKQRTSLRYFWRKKFGVKLWEDPSKGALNAKGEYRCDVGWSHYMGVYGSPGL